jgi:LysM repeat protein
MAVFETWLNQDLQKPLKPQVLDGSLFTQDNAGNLVGVVLFNNGEPEEISGTVGGMILRADGATVAVVDGNSNGNKGWIILPQSAYAVPGQIVIVIKVTNGSTVTTIGAATVGVQKSSTDTIVDPGTIISGIDTLIATIDAAIDSIPADWSSLLTSIAPVFSTNTAYNIGDYVWHTTGADAPAKLYKFTSAHAVGAWDASQVTAAVLSADIKNLQHIYTPTTGKPTSNLAPAFGGTVTLSQVKQDINGQVTVTDRTLTIPGNTATQSAAGLMSAQDKQKLDAVESGKYGVCSTAAATQTKAVSISGISSLTDGQTVTVRMTYEQEYNGQPKLNVSGTGAKNITRAGSAAAGKGEWQAGSVLCFVYNQTGDCWVIQNGNEATQYTYGKTIMDESTDGQTDIVRSLSSRTFFNTYIRDMITGAEVYDPTNTYALGAIVRRSGVMFRCTTAISTPEAWNSAHWERVLPIQEEIDTLRFDYTETMRNIITGADPYSATQAYSVGAYCIYGNTVYKCTTAIPSGEAWNSAHWEDQSNLFSTLQETKDKVDGGVGARNLLLNSAEPLVGNSNGATYTITRGVEVSEWGATNATRVTGTGASGVSSRSVFYIGGVTATIAYGNRTTVSGQKYSYSIYIKNNHATENCGIFSPLKSVITIAPGESKRVDWSVAGDGSGLIQIVFQSGSNGGAFDLTFWHPMIELGAFATDWVPAPEDYYAAIAATQERDMSTFASIRNANLFPNTSSGEIAKVGKIVTFAFHGQTIDALYANSQDMIGSVPSGLEPTTDVTFSVFVQSGGITSTVIERGVVTTEGTIDLYTANAASSGALVSGSATWSVS